MRHAYSSLVAFGLALGLAWGAAPAEASPGDDRAIEQLCRTRFGPGGGEGFGFNRGYRTRALTRRLPSNMGTAGPPPPRPSPAPSSSPITMSKRAPAKARMDMAPAPAGAATGLAVQAPRGHPPVAPSVVMAMEESVEDGEAAPHRPHTSHEVYPEAKANQVKLVSEDPVSTFSADVDTASYALARRNLNDHRWPARGSVRIEELVNAFDYAYPGPKRLEEGFRPTVHLYPAPWREHLTVMQIGIKAYDIPIDQRPAANLVFLLDVSGSMGQPDKLPLAKQAMCLLAHKLDKKDRVSMVVYAGASGVVLEPTPGDDVGAILTAMDRLRAGGSTHGSQGIKLAYAMAERHAEPGMANRVILVTDGDFNVGIYNPRDLITLVDRKRKSGVYLTVLGVGRGNYNDKTMQALAQNGNGVAAYIDSLKEARKVLVRSLTQSLVTVAKDVKLQVEFNPAKVAEYRLIGYETRALSRADFADDKVDAGETGSGHTVTALYELALTGSQGQRIAPSRYGRSAKPAGAAAIADEYAFLRIRFKTPDSDTSRLIERPVTEADRVTRLDEAPEDARFAAAVAWFAQRLRRDPVSDDWRAMRDLAIQSLGEDPYGDRMAFVTLIKTAESLDN